MYIFKVYIKSVNREEDLKSGKRTRFNNMLGRERERECLVFGHRSLNETYINL